MPSSLATLLTLGLIASLFYVDGRRLGKSSPALWIPVMWMSITGSRFVSQWINLGQWGYDSSVTDGSPLDAAYFASLIVAGAGVLINRRVRLGQLIQQNRWLTAFFVWGLLSILWSDYPLIASRRWIKTCGHPIMALIVLTEPDPARALRIVMRRCAFLLGPVSVLFIKYYPQYGRGFDQWSGAPINTGVGLTKNDLGYVCMIFGLYFVWDIVTRTRDTTGWRRWADRSITIGMLVMFGWLLMMSNSATSLSTFVLGTATLLAVRMPWIDPRRVGMYVALAVLVAASIQVIFDPYTAIVQMLGRDPSLTDRTFVWRDTLALQPSTLLGAGFESFWLGPRLEAMWAKWWWRPSQAHNGYIETYLNLGAVGMVLLLGTLIATLRSIGKQFHVDKDMGTFRIAFWIAIVAFNFTEAAFKGVHLVWTLFFIIALDCAGATLNAKRLSKVGVGRRATPSSRVQRKRDVGIARPPAYR